MKKGPVSYGILTPLYGKLNPHGILTPLISNQEIGRGPTYHMQGGKNTMGRGSKYHGQGVKIPWIGGSIYMYHGQGVKIPWVGCRYTMSRGSRYNGQVVDIPWARGLKYHGQGVIIDNHPMKRIKGNDDLYLQHVIKDCQVANFHEYYFNTNITHTSNARQFIFTDKTLIPTSYHEQIQCNLFS